MKGSLYTSSRRFPDVLPTPACLRCGPLHRIVLLACAVAILPCFESFAAEVETTSLPVMDPTKPAYPGVLTSPDPTKPPPFIERPDGALPQGMALDPATAAISPAVRARVESALATWKAADGGADFFPGLTYLRGNPIVMLVTSKQEADDTKDRRLRSVVTALEFLLEETTFDRATICVVAQNDRDPSPTVRNHVVRRENFKTAAKSAANVGSVKAAIARARAEPATARQICAALGID